MNTRIRKEDYELLNKLAKDANLTKTEILHIALTKFRKSEFFRKMNEAYKDYGERDT